jgi:ectoine hydroxylase-related dioxygenase (phytanoyl-CoA dioxygenase family)
MPNVLFPADLSHYHREGYVLVRGLVPAATCGIWRESVLQTGAPASGGKWHPVIFNHENPDDKREVHGALVHDLVLGAVEQLLGPQAQVWYGMAAVVPGGGGSGLPWHQDNQYNHILHHALNTFIALNDISQDMATLWVAPRSHLTGVRPAHLHDTGHREADVPPDNPLQLPALQAGDACIFNRNTLHRSLVNTTNMQRVAYAAQYVEASGVYAETGEPVNRITGRALQARWGEQRRLENGAGVA